MYVNASKHIRKDWVSLESQMPVSHGPASDYPERLLALGFMKHSLLHHTGSHMCIYVAFPLR